MNQRFLTIAALLAATALALSACGATAPLVVENVEVVDSAGPTAAAEATPVAATAEQPMPAGMGPGAGGGAGMMARHHAQIPEPYAGLANPVPVDDASLTRGQALYAVNCASCHGEDGMGDTAIGRALNPSPAPIAHTSRMLGDGYLFWRISEGGVPFGTAMPAWAEVLDEQARWDVINYVRNMGSDTGGPRAGMGVDEAEHRAEMLANALAQGVITAEEAALFERVHLVLDDLYPTGSMEGMGAGGMMTMQRALTDQAVRDGHITQADADLFTEIHDRLIEADLMQ